MSKKKNVVAFALGLILGRYGVPVLWHIVYITLIVIFAVGSCEQLPELIDKGVCETVE
jgi:hypothetical protein